MQPETGLSQISESRQKVFLISFTCPANIKVKNKIKSEINRKSDEKKRLEPVNMRALKEFEHENSRYMELLDRRDILIEERQVILDFIEEIETEDITTLARSIKVVQMVLFFKEIEKDTFRVSLRSKGTANAAYVAESFGGGGHLHAAGFSVTGEYQKLLKKIPEAVA